MKKVLALLLVLSLGFLSNSQSPRDRRKQVRKPPACAEWKSHRGTPLPPR